MKKIFLFAVILSLFLGLTARAEGFEFPDPGFMPNSVFYFLDSWSEKIGLLFAFSSEKKAEKALRYAEEKLSEARQMSDYKEDAAMKKAVKKYEQFIQVVNRGEAAKEKMRERLAAIKEKLPDEVKTEVEKIEPEGEEEAEPSETQTPTPTTMGTSTPTPTPTATPKPTFKPTPKITSKPTPGPTISSTATPRPTQTQTSTPAASPYDDFAKCLTQKGVKMYGASWCPHCVNQKAMFKESVKYMPYVECATANGGQAPVCSDAGIQAYPTWIFQNGQKAMGELSFEKISQYSGCAF